MRGLTHIRYIKVCLLIFCTLYESTDHKAAFCHNLWPDGVIGNRLCTYSAWEFYCHLMQVFDGQELIKTMKGKI